MLVSSYFDEVRNIAMIVLSMAGFSMRMFEQGQG